jgi:16S rRNA G527 N7-methylase RsmG
VLVEVRRNRAAFLNDVVSALELADVEVYPRRLETFREKADVCTARAFGSPSSSWEAAKRLLRPLGSLIYWAGFTFDATTDLPDGIEPTLFRSAGLARSGPLVIMTR